jgi:hypothetical protein
MESRGARGVKMASLEREEDASNISRERGSSPTFPSLEAFSQAATSVLHQLHALTGNIEGVGTRNPLGALRRLKGLDAALQALNPEFSRCFDHSDFELSRPVTGGTGPPSVAAVWMQNQLAGYLPSFLRLQSSWARAQAALEYKRAYAIAILAFYVSILSVVVGVIGCALAVISLLK